MELGRPRISNRIGLSTASKELLRIPPGARGPAEVSIRNVTGSVSTIYIKTVPHTSGGSVSAVDHGVTLNVGEAFTWSNPPAGTIWLGMASIAAAAITVEGNWVDPGYERPLYYGY